MVRQGRSILAGVDLTVDSGRMVALVGPSGAGKTTLLQVIGGRITPDRGSVTVLGVDDPGRLSGRVRRRAMGRIGSIAQDLHLAGSLRAVHNVNAGRLHRWSTPRAIASLIWPRDRASAEAALDQVGLADRLWARTDALSGGERQRVALARVLLHDPPLTLADEPVSSLDPSLADQAMATLAARTGTTVVSLHDPDLARRHADRIVGLRSGSVAFDLAAADVSDALLDDLYGGSLDAGPSTPHHDGSPSPAV